MKPVAFSKLVEGNGDNVGREQRPASDGTLQRCRYRDFVEGGNKRGAAQPTIERSLPDLSTRGFGRSGPQRLLRRRLPKAIISPKLHFTGRREGLDLTGEAAVNDITC